MLRLMIASVALTLASLASAAAPQDIQVSSSDSVAMYALIAKIEDPTCASRDCAFHHTYVMWTTDQTNPVVVFEVDPQKRFTAGDSDAKQIGKLLAKYNKPYCDTDDGMTVCMNLFVKADCQKTGSAVRCVVLPDYDNMKP